MSQPLLVSLLSRNFITGTEQFKTNANSITKQISGTGSCSVSDFLMKIISPILENRKQTTQSDLPTTNSVFI